LFVTNGNSGIMNANNSMDISNNDTDADTNPDDDVRQQDDDNASSGSGSGIVADVDVDVDVDDDGGNNNRCADNITISNNNINSNSNSRREDRIVESIYQHMIESICKDVAINMHELIKTGSHEGNHDAIPSTWQLFSGKTTVPPTRRELYP
jgi:hypothetical protein